MLQDLNACLGQPNPQPTRDPPEEEPLTVLSSQDRKGVRCSVQGWAHSGSSSASTAFEPLSSQ